jgi:aspartate/methionine/tyrosine aminotransferase
MVKFISKHRAGMKFLFSLFMLLFQINHCHSSHIRLPNGITVAMEFGNLYYLAKTYEDANSQTLMAIVGKPTAPLSNYIKQGMMDYWQKISSKDAIDYGHTQGEKEYRDMIAEAINREYELTDQFHGDEVLFTVGGAAGLQNIFYMLRHLDPEGVIVTPTPYYPNYRGNQGNGETNNIHFVNLIDCKTAKLTSHCLKGSLDQLHGKKVIAFLFCDPSNPMGTTVGLEEWKSIAKILQDYPEAYIILDEAYAEMVFYGPHQSLIKAAPHLMDRIILIRSATKGLSAAGERMAITVTKNKQIMNLMVAHNTIRMLHAPKSHQHAYAYALSHITRQDYQHMAAYYQPKVMYIYDTLKELGFIPQGLDYKPDSTFYVLADLSLLIGQPLSTEAQKILIDNTSGKIESDLDIAVHLLTKYHLALAPLSFFGVDAHKGWLRITCSLDQDGLEKIVNIFKQIKQDCQSV